MSRALLLEAEGENKNKKPKKARGSIRMALLRELTGGKVTGGTACTVQNPPNAS